jgi:hypothetical protein
MVGEVGKPSTPLSFWQDTMAKAETTGAALDPAFAWSFPFLEPSETAVTLSIFVQTQFCEIIFPSEIGSRYEGRKQPGTRLASDMHKEKSQVRVTKTIYL